MNILNDISFAYPWVLWFLLVPVGVWIYQQWFQNKKPVALTLSTIHAVVQEQVSIQGKIIKLLPIVRLLTLMVLIVAIARPQSTYSERQVNVEGIDIALAIDVSTSMLAKDFSPNRLEAAKAVAKTFINKRPNDRIGLVIFAGESFTQCPVTIDHPIVIKQLDNVKNGLIEDGTAIGLGIATCINRLKNSDAKSKVIILLTDGVSNKGSIDPLTAADLAGQFDIRIYTIGAGSKGQALSPVGRYPNGKLVYEQAEVQIDEKLLKEVAKKNWRTILSSGRQCLA